MGTPISEEVPQVGSPIVEGVQIEMLTAEGVQVVTQTRVIQ